MKTEKVNVGVGITPLRKSGVNRAFYCQSEIEGNRKCTNQCEHCKEYYKPLEQ